MLEIAIPTQVAGQTVALRVVGDIPPWATAGNNSLGVGAGPAGSNGTGDVAALIESAVLGGPAVGDYRGRSYFDGSNQPARGSFDFTTQTFTAPTTGSLYLTNIGFDGTPPLMVIRGLWWVTSSDPFDNIVTGKRNVRAHFVG